MATLAGDLAYAKTCVASCGELAWSDVVARAVGCRGSLLRARDLQERRYRCSRLALVSIVHADRTDEVRT